MHLCWKVLSSGMDFFFHLTGSMNGWGRNLRVFIVYCVKLYYVHVPPQSVIRIFPLNESWISLFIFTELHLHWADCRANLGRKFLKLFLISLLCFAMGPILTSEILWNWQIIRPTSPSEILPFPISCYFLNNGHG